MLYFEICQVLWVGSLKLASVGGTSHLTSIFSPAFKCAVCHHYCDLHIRKTNLLNLFLCYFSFNFYFTSFEAESLFAAQAGLKLITLWCQLPTYATKPSF